MAVTEGQTENGLRRFVATGNAPRAIRGGKDRPDRNQAGDEAGASAKDAGVNVSSINAATADPGKAAFARRRVGSEQRQGVVGGTGGFPVTEPRVPRNVFRRSDADAVVIARSDAGAGQGAIPHDRLSGS